MILLLREDLNTLSKVKIIRPSMEHTLPETQKEEQLKGWVRDYADMMYRHALLRGFAHDNAKDLVQETFIAAWKNMDGFQGKASGKNWLFVILKNKITDHYRKASAHVQVHISEYDQHFDETGHWAKLSFPKALTVDPADSDRAELHQILEGCSSKLNGIQKAVFFMKYMDDLTSNDICAQLSITATNYWTILHRTKVQLRACMEKNWLQTKSV